MASTAIQETVQGLRALRKEPLVVAAVLAVLALIAVFVVYPVLRVISFPSPGDFSVLVENDRWYKATVNSLFITLLSTVSATVIGFVFAFTLVRVDTPLRRIFKFVSLLPIVSPPFIIALSYILLFGRSGLITKKLLGLNLDMYGWHGVWLVQTITYFPYAYVIIKGVLQEISANLEYAGYNLGARHWQVFRDIVLPLATPGLCGASLVVAIMVLADFGNPLLVGGNFFLLPTEAYMQIIGWYNLNTAAVLATALLLPALVFFILQHYWLGKRSYVTITGKESPLRHMELPRLAQRLLVGFCAAVSLLIFLVYGVLVVGAFSKVWGYDWSFSLVHLDYVWNRKAEIINSVRFAFVSSLLTAVFSMVLAYIVQKKQLGFNKVLDFLAILPGAVPGLFLGIGYLMAFNQQPLQLAGSGWIIILALMFWNIPTGYAAAVAGLQQISNSIEEAGANLGASTFRTFRDIILPLLILPFTAGFVVAFLRAVTCLSVVVFLVTPTTVVGTISILGLVTDGNWSGAAAFTVVLISIAFAVLYSGDYLLGRRGKSLDL